MKEIKFLAIIPARGGSKRLPKKNIKHFCGKPLIQWTIECAKSCSDIEEVIVSTDCPDIAAISRAAGAKVPFMRPSDLAADQSSSFELVKHAINFYAQKDVKIKNIILLQPTSPLRTTKNLQEAINRYNEEGANAVVSVTKLEHNPLSIGELESNGSLSNIIKKINSSNHTSNQLNYRINGAIYILNCAKIIQHSNLFFDDQSFAYIMPNHESVDIDTIEDFITAEALFLWKQKNNV
jgi:CMP-N-acetylneuraminic acid synthetase